MGAHTHPTSNPNSNPNSHCTMSNANSEAAALNGVCATRDGHPGWSPGMVTRDGHPGWCGLHCERLLLGPAPTIPAYRGAECTAAPT